MNVRIKGEVFPLLAAYAVTMGDDWDFRQAFYLSLMADYAAVKTLFTDNAPWSTFVEGIEGTELDRSDYCVAGRIIDFRNGRIGVYMGKRTEAERLAAELQDARAALALLGVTEEPEENGAEEAEEAAENVE